MGLIREPKDVDFYVDPTPLTEEEKADISEAIAYYKATGKIKKQNKNDAATKVSKSGRNKPKHKLAA